MIRRLVLALLLLAPAGAMAQLSPMGFGRPPGLGPELDRNIIAQMRSLQSFITTDLGVALTDAPRTRAGIMERNIFGWWRLQSFYRTKFRTWYRTLNATPGAMVLGISVAGMPYTISHMQADYNETELGNYHAFQRESTASGKLVTDTRKLHAMAQGYIDRLEARLKFESERGIAAGATAGGAQAGSEQFSDLRPNQTPTTILNIHPQGGAHVDDLMRRRRERKGIE